MVNGLEHFTMYWSHFIAAERKNFMKSLKKIPLIPNEPTPILPDTRIPYEVTTKYQTDSDDYLSFFLDKETRASL